MVSLIFEVVTSHVPLDCFKEVFIDSRGMVVPLEITTNSFLPPAFRYVTARFRRIPIHAISAHKYLNTSTY